MAGGEVVPLLIGSNAEEARALTDVIQVKAATFDSDLEHSFGRLPHALSGTNPHAPDKEARQARLDLRFSWDMRAWARLQSKTGKGPVYYYSFRCPTGSASRRSVIPRNQVD